MHPIEHPDTIMLIHKTMVKGEMERNDRTNHNDLDRPGPTNRPGGGLRRAISNVVTGVGAWLEPRDRPADQAGPVGNPR